MRWLLICGWLTLAPVGAEVAEGILYYAEGGSGAGQVQLLSAGDKLLRLRYSKDNLRDRTTATAWRYGSYWRVQYQGNQLQEIHYLGKQHPQIAAADQMLRMHYRLMAQGRWADAYGDLSLAWRRTQSLAAFEKGSAQMRYAPDPPLYALKVIDHSDKDVTLLMDGAAMFLGSRSYFRVVVRFEGGRPVIDQVTPISQAEFYR